MSRWARELTEFHQLITPDGYVYDLHTASRRGKWVISSQGWGMPPIDYITQKTPFQHGATVKDYRLQPRIIQLLLQQSFCDREALFSGRQALLDVLRPNRTPIAFNDYWIPRSDYQSGGVYPIGPDQQIIGALAELNDTLYAGTGDDGAGTGGVLMAWDGAGSLHSADVQAFCTNGGVVTYGTAIRALLKTTVTLPKYTSQLGIGPETLGEFYDENDDENAPVHDVTTWYGQSFTPAADVLVSKIQLKIHKTIQMLYSKVFCEIYETDGVGHPTGDPLTYAQVYGYYLPITDDWVTFPLGFDTAYQYAVVYSGKRIVLQAGTKYCIVMRLSANTSGWYGGDVVFRRDGSAPSYAGGASEISLDGGVTWGTDASKDYMFRVYGYAEELTYAGSEDREVLLAGCGTDGIVVPWDGEWLDESAAPQYDVENTLWALVEWNGAIYAGTGPTGKLLQYAIDPVTAIGSLTEVLPQLVAANIYSLAVFDDGGGEDLYAGTDLGSLYMWDGVAANWVEVAPQAGGTELGIFGLIVYQGSLYGVSSPGGYLWQYDAALGQWTAVSQSVLSDLWATAVFKGRLYAAGFDGRLYRWNNLDTLDQVCVEFTGAGGVVETVLPMFVYRNRLFAGTYNGAYLLEYVRESYRTQPEAMVLRRLLPGGAKRDVRVFITEGPDFDANEGEGWDQLGFKELVRFIAQDPVLYDPAAVTVPMLLGTGFVSHLELVTYLGTWQTHPQILLTGPMVQPQIINESLDVLIALDYTIPDGDIVTIDTSLLTVRDNHGVNLLGVLSPESQLATFRLEPSPAVAGGVNSIIVVGSGMNGNSDCDLIYYRRYIGL